MIKKMQESVVEDDDAGRDPSPPCLHSFDPYIEDLELNAQGPSMLSLEVLRSWHM